MLYNEDPKRNMQSSFSPKLMISFLLLNATGPLCSGFLKLPNEQ